jgi:Tfp pilus assembly protein PilZ
MSDLRHHHRYCCRLRVRCKNPELAFDSLTRDICVGGVFVITDHLLPLNSSIDLEITGDGPEPAIHCRGRVAWVNAGQVETFPPGFGVEFLEGEEQMIRRLLNDLGF